MKRLIKKTKSVVRGVPTAFLLSAAIHIALLTAAGALVVFTLTKKKPPQFIPPPPVDRPKMELRKPRVKVKKNIKPRATQRITAKNVAIMPEIQLPEISGLGGLGGELVGFDLMPDLSEMSLYGSTKSIAVGNDFEGTFYSLALDRRKRETNMDRERCYDLVKRFIEAGWNPLVFSRFFRAPNKLYNTHFILPPDTTAVGPDAFGFDDPDFPSGHWLVHYKGKIACRKDGRFRFWGAGDDMFIVRMNGKVVLDASWVDKRGFASGWEKPNDPEDSTYFLGNTSAKVGDWFELKAETPVEMEVIMYNNEFNTNHILAIQDEDEEYDRNRQDMRVLPAFKTAEFPEAIRIEIEYMMIRDEVDLLSNLMFNVH